MSDDCRQDTSTTGYVAVGGTATGEIETSGDRDWFAVDLLAGHTCVIDLRVFSISSTGSMGKQSPFLRCPYRANRLESAKAPFGFGMSPTFGSDSKGRNDNSLMSPEPGIFLLCCAFLSAWTSRRTRHPRLLSGFQTGTPSPLTAKLKPAFRYLVWLLLPFLLSACDGSDSASLGASQDPITPEIRSAIEAGDLAPLSASDLPEIPGIAEFIVDHNMAVVLGKAFFWEMYAGNSGQACASCHFHAGTDRRIQNTLHPGGRDVAFFRGDAARLEEPLFDLTRSGFPGGPNYILSEHDFPFHDKADAADRDSPTLFDTDDVVGSQGVLNAEFHSLGLDGRTRIGEDPDDTVDCEPVADDLFNVGGSIHPQTRVRRVTPRSTPTMINAALNHRNFWMVGPITSSTASTRLDNEMVMPGCGK